MQERIKKLEEKVARLEEKAQGHISIEMVSEELDRLIKRTNFMREREDVTR